MTKSKPKQLTMGDLLDEMQVFMPLLMLEAIFSDLRRGGFRGVYLEDNRSGWFRPRHRDLTKRCIAVNVPDDCLLVEVNIETKEIVEIVDLTESEERLLTTAFATAASNHQRRRALDEWRPELP